ncbi:Ig-like domain-containing protein [Sporosarcina soli]|uniref:Ig-like domain-containing protein n=1 Tax=Sporosarcina soli TaxID=334736 RepID=A0ABW0TI15_9BACL
MKQRTKIVVAFLAMFFVILATSQLANAKEWTLQTNDDVNKVWNIRFNYPIDPSSLSTDSVYVLDGTKKHTITLGLAEGGKMVSVTPTTSYEMGKTYRLMITNALQSNDGQALMEPVELPFQIVNPNDKIQSVYSKTVNLFTTVTVKTSSDVHSVKVSGDEMKYEGNNTYTLTLVDAKIGSTLTIYGYDENGKRIETKKYKIE